MRELAEKIIKRIASDGAITFRDFMEMALYDRQYGYYSSRAEQIGRKGDYYTSANVDAAFGALLAKQCVEFFVELDCRDRFTIVEIGAGTGQLAFDILQALIVEQNIDVLKID